MSSDQTESTRKSPGFLSTIKPTVFWPALILLIIIVAISMLFPTTTGELLSDVQATVIDGIGWYYILAVTGFVVFSLWVGLSHFGDIKLGPDNEEAEYSFLVWFCMLFAAGMGIGLVFWGVAEPLTFFTNPRPGVTGDEADLAAAAMSQTFLHWGFHAWSIYVIVGLALAYSIHRKGNPISIRWALEPLFGDRVKGGLGDAIDVFAIIGTVAGVATSLALGVSQIGAGLVYLGVFDELTDPILVGLIVCITAIATISVVSGLDRGIKYLSNINIAIAAAFAAVILALGPTLFLLNGFVQNIGRYLSDIVSLSFATGAFEGADGIAWTSGWTTFYWGWWISWAPFVGIFIARVSRGRTVREFVFGVLLVPTLVSAIWFSIMGGSALYRQMFGEGGLTNADGSVTNEAALFGLLDGFPASTFLAGVAIVLVTIFFVTSSDSGSLVVDMLASGGDPNPPTWSRVLWSSTEGLVAIGLLLAGGIGALQTGAILTAVPFSVIMIAMCFAMFRSFKAERRETLRLDQKARERELREEVEGHVADAFAEHSAQTGNDPAPPTVKP